MDINEVREYVAQELFSPQGSRRSPNANRWPDVDTTEHGVSVDALEGIIDDALTHLGFSRIDPLLMPLRGHVTYGRLEMGGRIAYIRVSWDLEHEAFNPYVHIQPLEQELFPLSCIQGPPLGVDRPIT